MSGRSVILSTMFLGKPPRGRLPVLSAHPCQGRGGGVRADVNGEEKFFFFFGGGGGGGEIRGGGGGVRVDVNREVTFFESSKKKFFFGGGGVRVGLGGPG